MVDQSQRWDVLCLGEALVQLDQGASGQYAPDAGGDALMVAVAVARMGGQATLVSRVGCDEFGDTVLSALEQAGVDTGFVQRDLTVPTAHMFRHRIGAVSHRQFCRVGAATGHIRSDDFDVACVAQARVLHLSGVTLGLSPMMRSVADCAVKHAQSAGALLSCYPCYQPDLWSEDVGRNALLGQLRLSDIAFVRLAETQFLLGLSDGVSAIGRLLGLGVQMVVLIEDAGIWVATPSGRSFVAANSSAVTRPDVFIGAFLSGLTAGDELSEVAARAADAARHAADHGGGAGAVPELTEFDSYPDTAISPSAARVQPMRAAP